MNTSDTLRTPGRPSSSAIFSTRRFSVPKTCNLMVLDLVSSAGFSVPGRLLESGTVSRTDFKMNRSDSFASAHTAQGRATTS